MNEQERIAEHRRAALRERALADCLEDGTYEAFIAASYERVSVGATGAMIASERWCRVGPLAAELQLSNQATNNRLAKLCRLGILERRRIRVEAGGKMYEYHWVLKP